MTHPHPHPLPLPLRMRPALAAALLAGSLATAWAHDHTGGLRTPVDKAARAPFDIVHTKISTEGNTAVFHMAVSGRAGASRPARSGKLAGSQVFSYVWPTSLDSAVVGFEPRSGILAFAVTAHPDFDDTPLFDENGDGDPGNDGNVWHSHWVVLAPDAACGPDALKVVDIPAGSKPKLPKTWPGLPILIDSPGWAPIFNRDSVQVRVPFDDVAALGSVAFDGVTAALRVNASVHSPLLCVSQVCKVASGKLTLPGRVDE